MQRFAAAEAGRKRADVVLERVGVDPPQRRVEEHPVAKEHEALHHCAAAAMLGAGIDREPAVARSEIDVVQLDVARDAPLPQAPPPNRDPLEIDVV